MERPFHCQRSIASPAGRGGGDINYRSEQVDKVVSFRKWQLASLSLRTGNRLFYIKPQEVNMPDVPTEKKNFNYALQIHQTLALDPWLNMDIWFTRGHRFVLLVESLWWVMSVQSDTNITFTADAIKSVRAHGQSDLRGGRTNTIYCITSSLESNTDLIFFFVYTHWHLTHTDFLIFFF